MRELKHVKRINLLSRDVYLYEVKKENQARVYILWEKRDLFKGENELPKPFEFKFGFRKAKITDAFGAEEVKYSSNGILQLNVTDTPIYVEAF
jgi:hypothetical protein